MVSGSRNRPHNQPVDYPPGFVTSCLAQPILFEGAEKWGKRRPISPHSCASSHIPQFGALASCWLTQHPKGGVAFTYQPSRSLPGGSARFSKDPPLSGRPRKGGTGGRPAPATSSTLSSHRLGTRPGCPPSCSPLLTCSADTAPFPAPLPLLLPARPLLSAIFAACWASGVRSSAPPCVTSGLEVTAHSPRSLCFQAALRFGSCGWFWLYLHVGPTSYRVGRSELHLRCFNLCNRDTASGRSGKDGLTGEWGAGGICLGASALCPPRGGEERGQVNFPSEILG